MTNDTALTSRTLAHLLARALETIVGAAVADARQSKREGQNTQDEAYGLHDTDYETVRFC